LPLLQTRWRIRLWLGLSFSYATRLLVIKDLEA